MTARYEPFGAALDLFHAQDEEVILSGPAGTGKSRACLEKLYRLAWKYPGMRGLILRKTRESLTQSALFTFEEKVVGKSDPILQGPQRNMRQSYRFPNGSEIVIGGLDKPQKVMSTEFDVAYIQEAIEVTETDWEMVTTRLRNAIVPYQQLIADTNPDAPSHWLKKRADRGAVRLIESRHEDNPTCTGEYLAKLDALTGVRKERLRFGRWVAAEGTVYESWDAAVHRVDPFPIPATWPRYWTVDFGYNHAFVWQAWARDDDGRLFRYREIFHTGRLVEDHAKDILAATVKDPRPSAILCDHDAEDRATLERHLGMRTLPAYKAVSPGIQAVEGRLRDHRLFYLRDSLVRRDPALVEKKKPTCTEEEFDSYIWNLAGGRRKGEEPVKENDDGMDASRYCVAHVDSIAKRPQKAAGF
jgi:PBSX family phage terminase large subunit